MDQVHSLTPDPMGHRSGKVQVVPGVRFCNDRGDLSRLKLAGQPAAPGKQNQRTKATGIEIRYQVQQNGLRPARASGFNSVKDGVPLHVDHRRKTSRALRSFPKCQLATRRKIDFSEEIWARPVVWKNRLLMR